METRCEVKENVNLKALPLMLSGYVCFVPLHIWSIVQFMKKLSIYYDNDPATQMDGENAN